METVVVVGGGASGIVSAISIKKNNDKNRVIVLERNSSCLKKLLMTGNGKCNYFNDIQDSSKYYSQNMDIVNNIITDDNMREVISFFDNLGIIYKKKNGYYYPFSNQATTIKDALLLEANRVGVEIINNCLVKDVRVHDNGFSIVCDNDIIDCNKVVISSGSLAYPKTGSDGMGYEFLKRLGHTIIKPLPALVPMISDFKYCKDWAGIRTDAVLSLYEDDKFISSESGELQLTDYGISGICTFNLSHVVTRGLDNNKKEKILINFVPFIDGNVSEWLDNYSSLCSNKNIKELLDGFLNNKLVNVILKYCCIDNNLNYSEIDDSLKNKLVSCLESFPINIIGVKSFDFSQVCNGGVSIEEINPDTFESLIIPNLFISGELLDINGICGGYNLTIAWLSGLLIGKGVI